MRSSAAAVFLLAALLPLAACSGNSQPQPASQAAAQLSFGVEMAHRGLWNEALFRFREAEKLEPGNPHIQSNLGVAYEASGQFDRALEYYQKALKLAPGDKEIRANYGRFVEFYQGFKGEKTPKAADENKNARPPVPAPGVHVTPPGGEEPSTPEDMPPPPADVLPPPPPAASRPLL